MILHVGILNVGHHIRGKLLSGVAVRGEGGVAGEGRVVGVPKFHSWACHCNESSTEYSLSNSASILLQ